MCLDTSLQCLYLLGRYISPGSRTHITQGEIEPHPLQVYKHYHPQLSIYMYI